MVQGGGLIMRNCLLSLRSLPKHMLIKIPCLVSLRKTMINLVDCEFVGNDYNMTTGCIILESDAVISSSKFNNFKGGAIFSVSDVNTEVEIKDCEIKQSSVVGIYC